LHNAVAAQRAGNALPSEVKLNSFIADLHVAP
jgi:hypothetical protein